MLTVSRRGPVAPGTPITLSWAVPGDQEPTLSWVGRDPAASEVRLGNGDPVVSGCPVPTRGSATATVTGTTTFAVSAGERLCRATVFVHRPLVSQNLAVSTLPGIGTHLLRRTIVHTARADDQAAADLDAVWSFWTPPYTAFYRWSWADDLTHLCSWIMSVRTAERHFPRRRLVTDDGGARMLVDQLGLPFTSVSTTLNALTEPDPRWWALGKLYAYREQQHPFVHLDSDVYLFGGLPDRLRKAAVFTQNPEPAPVSDATYYRPSAFLRTVREAGGWLPAAFSDYVDRGGDIALCTGIVGGRDLDLIGEYADQAIRLVEHSDNRPVWPDVEWLLSANVLVEQYLLGAVLDRARRSGRTAAIEHLFSSPQEAFGVTAPTAAGYTHLIASAKCDPVVSRLLVNAVRRLHPVDFARAVAMT